jgi:hypothetical protein
MFSKCFRMFSRCVRASPYPTEPVVGHGWLDGGWLTGMVVGWMWWLYGGLVACRAQVPADVPEGVSAPGHHGQVPLSRPKPRGSQRRLLAGRLTQTHNEHEHDIPKWGHGQGAPEHPHAQVEADLLHCVLLKRDGPKEDAEHGLCHDVSQGEADLLVQGGLFFSCKAPVLTDVHEGVSAPGHHGQVPLSRPKPRGSQRRLLAGRLIQAHNEHEHDIAKWDPGHGPPEPPHAPVEVVLLHGLLLRGDGPNEHGLCHDVSKGGGRFARPRWPFCLQGPRSR